MNEYAELNLREHESERLSAFIEKLSEFHQVIERGFSRVGQRHHELVVEVKTISEKIEKRFASRLDLVTQPLRVLNAGKQIKKTPEGKRLRCDQNSK